MAAFSVDNEDAAGGPLALPPLPAPAPVQAPEPAARADRPSPSGRRRPVRPAAPPECSTRAAAGVAANNNDKKNGYDDGGEGNDEDDTALATRNDREATELAPLPPSSFVSPTSAPASLPVPPLPRRPWRGAAARTPAAADEDDEGDCDSRRRAGRRRGRLARWWGRQVCVTVAAGGMRDHLALERTFLGYLRTSIALSMTGVLIAQLMRLQHAPDPDPAFGYFALARPLAATFIAAAVAVVLLGAFRFWRQQNAIVRGKVLAGGWEVWAIMAGSLILTTTVFGLMLAVDIKKELDNKV